MGLILKDETYRILGACFEVYREKGCGFVEAVYQECLGIEMQLQEIPFRAKARLCLSYKDTPLVHHYEPDFICFEQVIVEAKAVSGLLDQHRAQTHNYLKSSGLQVALLVNFCHYPMLEYERIIR